VAWGDGTQIRVRTVSVNGVLGPIQDVALLGFWQNRNPQVAVAPNGDAVIAWLEDGNSSHTGAPAGTVWPAGGVWAVRRQSDGTLGEVVDAWVDISLRNPNQLAIDSDGNAAFTWNRDYAGGQVYVRRWPSGRQLAPSQGLGLTNWLPGAPGTESYWGSGMDPSGNVLVVWQGWGGGGMWTSSVAADGTVTETSAPFPMGDNFHIALNAAGDAVIGWRCYRGSRGNTTYVVERAPNGALGPATRLTAGLGRATSPLVDLNDAGRAVAAWISPQDAPRVQISRNP
jgi:hypothetical protein